MRYVKLTFPKPEPEPLVVQVYDSDSDAAGDPHDDELPLIAKAALAAMSDEQRREVLPSLLPESVAADWCRFYGAPTADQEVARLRELVERMRPVVEAAERARDRRDPCLDNYAGMTQHDLNLWRAVDEYRRST